jgi:hypothetical protein
MFFAGYGAVCLEFISNKLVEQGLATMLGVM